MNQNRLQKGRKQRIREWLPTVTERIDRACEVNGQLTPPKALTSQYDASSHAKVGLHFFRDLLDFCDPTRTSPVRAAAAAPAASAAHGLLPMRSSALSKKRCAC